jgi:hypothetical protein
LARSYFKHTKPLQERLAEFAADARKEVAGMPDGAEREKVLKAIKCAETASEIEKWTSSAELAPKQPS